MKLDDTTMKGTLGVADFASKALRFDLNVDRIDADRYLPPPDGAAAAQDAAEEEPPTEIPVDMLRKLNARGQLRIGEAIFAGMKFTKLRLGVNARDGTRALQSVRSIDVRRPISRRHRHRRDWRRRARNAR